jgi:hypothetical protein
VPGCVVAGCSPTSSGVDGNGTGGGHHNLGVPGAVADLERVQNAVGVGDEVAGDRIVGGQRLRAVQDDEAARDGALVTVPDRHGMVETAAADGGDDILRAAQAFLRQDRPVRPPVAVGDGHDRGMRGADLVRVGADVDVVASGAGQWLDHHRPRPAPACPGGGLVCRRRAQAGRGGQAGRPQGLGHLERVPAGVRAPPAIAGSSQDGGEPVGELHPGLAAREHR